MTTNHTAAACAFLLAGLILTTSPGCSSGNGPGATVGEEAGAAVGRKATDNNPVGEAVGAAAGSAAGDKADDAGKRKK
jgi:hypothetical protein